MVSNIHHHYVQSHTEIMTANLNIPEDYRLECIREINLLGDSMDSSTNIKGQMTTYQVWKESKVFDPLIMKIFNFMYTEEVQSEGIPEQAREKTLGLNSCWGGVYRKGDKTVEHIHVPNYLSFVYYLQSNPNEDAPLIFGNTTNNMKINPTNDLLVIFASHLSHHVPVQESENERVILAGNLSIYDKVWFDNLTQEQFDINNLFNHVKYK